eukprot:SAG31_NODE_4691_length_3030_cov_1.452747_5_plen_89_part_00
MKTHLAAELQAVVASQRHFVVARRDLQGDTISISPGSLGAYMGDSAGKNPHENEKVTVDFSVRIWQIQQEKSHRNEKVSLLTAFRFRK